MSKTFSVLFSEKDKSGVLRFLRMISTKTRVKREEEFPSLMPIG
jgi:hypothetical protein